MTTTVGSVTLIQSADGTKPNKKTDSGKSKKIRNSVFVNNQPTQKIAYPGSIGGTGKVGLSVQASSSGGCGFWSKLGSGLKALACGAGSLLAGGIKAFGGLLGLGGKMIGGLGAALGSSNLGFGLGAGLGALGIYNSIGNGGVSGFGGFGFGGWPFMTTSGFYSPLCSGVGGMCGGWRAPAFVAGGFPNMLSCNGFGAANVLGFDFGAFGNRPIAGMHASQNPLAHYWSCGGGGKSVFGFN